MKGNSSHIGQEVEVGGRTDKQTEKRFCRNNKQKISMVRGLRETVVSDESAESRQAWFIVYFLPSGKQLL